MLSHIYAFFMHKSKGHFPLFRAIIPYSITILCGFQFKKCCQKRPGISPRSSFYLPLLMFTGRAAAFLCAALLWTSALRHFARCR